MPSVALGNYDYVPVLGTGEVERIAYGRIREETRSGILPAFELTRRRGDTNLDAAIALVQETVTAPFLIDLDKRYAPPPYQSQNPSNPIAE